MTAPRNKPLTILLASPRGFCAGVDRAIQIVERAIERYGRPVYVRHEIVHNRFVVENLEAKGAIFVDELDEVPDDRPVVFSAHGVPKSVPAEAGRRKLLYVDATCPLVSKVHREAERHAQSGRTVILIGHAGHPEVIGTMGQLPPGKVVLVEDVAQAEALAVADTANLAYATQTTLSVDDTTGIVAVLRRRFPAIQGPKMEDICYATTNRQAAVKAIAERCDAMVVIGAPNSSNSMRLVEVAANYGCTRSRLVQRAGDMDWGWLEESWKSDARRLGITAGASAPELLVDELIAACRERYDVTVEEVRTTEESVVFKLPRALVA
ncbi:MAG: 4-hydroxy-3-methylbut-2-enyl diphosphate reductase [Reyranella sp.]|jgi:4-hydroxy-3-methylbut-2-en-1-yl diphosphate reductase|nr:4-hydroxy-3-methylbut-2-enyl diphosphate reductase [Reyranella sp.]